MGEDGIAIDIDLDTQKLRARHLKQFLRRMLQAQLEQLDRDYEDADREVMAGKADASLYGRKIKLHLQALSQFRIHGPEGIKFAVSFMVQVAIRLFDTTNAKILWS